MTLPPQPPDRGLDRRRRRLGGAALLAPALLPPLAPMLSALLAPGAARAAPPAATRVRFEIDLSAEIAAGRFDPRRDRLGLRGSAAPLNWEHPLFAEPIGSGRYAATVDFPAAPPGGQALQYKARIEREGLGPGEGWEEGRNRVLAFDAARIDVRRAFNAPPGPIPVSRVGRIDRLSPMRSRHVGARGVQVWVPPDYDAATSLRYPVLYLHDGQLMFDAQETGAELQVDETAQRLVLAGQITPPLIVAIDAVPADRLVEYTPSAGLLQAADAKASSTRVGGGLAAYARYLAEELKPSIDAAYRTRPAAADTAVGGISLGGLASLWLVLHRGETFGAGLAVSPSAWWDDEFAARDAARATLPVPWPRLWLDTGTAEGDDTVPATRRLRDALRQRGWPPERLAYLEAEGASHDEASWSQRVEGMLRFLYGAPA